MSCRIAILGGGPGGLMTAYQLQQRCPAPFETTIYEASGRLGGKVLTPRFLSVPVAYEAGAAELYDYSHTGEDPLRELVERLGLRVRPMSGESVVLDGLALQGAEDVGRLYGEPARRALEEFDLRARRWMDPQDFYDSDWQESNADPRMEKTFEEELRQVPDAAARRYLRTLVHSDLATEPHHTSASYGLQNYLMNDPGYMTLYTIEGGIERLVEELAVRVKAAVRLREPVVRVERTVGDRLRVVSRPAASRQAASRQAAERQAGREGPGAVTAEEYDFVVVALPNNYLPGIDWGGGPLGEAMHRHHIHYDYPAHYLRVSVLFREAFWRQQFKDSYMMLDAFGGCCLYDESARNDCGGYGALGWLLAGEAAMTASNCSDEALIEMALDSLPPFMQQGPEMFLEGRVHRWIGAVNGLPGGRPVRDMESRHTPEPAQPNLMVVGDYLFDSTLNGVLDSADFVAELLAKEIEARTMAPAALHGASV